MPLANLDYLFELSDEKVHQPPILKQNLVLLGTRAPANGGLFMLSPLEGDIEHINAVIKAKESYIHEGNSFDEIAGWGETMGFWTGYKGNGTGWTFIAASGDQGLLWYWVAFVKKQVSVVAPCDDIQNWDVTQDSKGKMVVKEILHKPFGDHGLNYSWVQCTGKPLSDIYHFMGSVKATAKQGCRFTQFRKSQNKTAANHWCYALKQVNEEHGLGIDMLSVKQENGRLDHPDIARRFNQSESLTNLLNW